MQKLAHIIYGYDFIIKEFYHIYKSCVHFSPKFPETVQVYLENNTIVMYKDDEFVKQLMYPFIKQAKQHVKSFNYWCCKYLDKEDEDLLIQRLWEDVQEICIIYVNSNIDVYTFKDYLEKQQSEEGNPL